jgi:hypothetical protein
MAVSSNPDAISDPWPAGVPGRSYQRTNRGRSPPTRPLLTGVRSGPGDDRRELTASGCPAMAAHNFGLSGEASRVRAGDDRPVSGVVLFSDAR